MTVRSTDIIQEMYLTLSARKVSDLNNHTQTILRKASENFISGLFPANTIQIWKTVISSKVVSRNTN